MADFDPAAARAAFREGKVALLIDRPEHAAEWTNPKTPFPVEVAALPASTRVFDPARKVWLTPRLPNRVAYLPGGGGWLAGIGAHAKGKTYEAAVSLLQSLASPETAQAIVSDPAFPMTPVRNSHLALGLPDPRSALGVDSRSWGNAVSQSFDAPRVVIGLRIPESNEYLDDLGRALQSAMSGERTPEDALAEAAKSWDARTTRLGRQRQLWHYRRSLNRLSTTSTPPERP
jgi:multiple sugar transport system substrate-binding protein